MSGIYLIVWDFKNKDRSPVLKSTKGGYPHITIMWTGQSLSIENLLKTGTECLNEWLRKDITLSEAYVSSFTDMAGNVRNDVLLKVNDVDALALNDTRTRLIRNVYPNADSFTMNPFHVTHCIDKTKEEAEQIVRHLNKTALPCTVTVTGLSI